MTGYVSFMKLSENIEKHRRQQLPENSNPWCDHFFGNGKKISVNELSSPYATFC
uniref:Uncharacterized protein MANES_14G058100 n=1 Tax=Rhizophora mucronata TaxID=61149 RepID=A0A2P2QAI7_RHIMU